MNYRQLVFYVVAFIIIIFVGGYVLMGDLKWISFLTAFGG